MNILTGFYTHTSGTALINGYDIKYDMDQIRQSLGIYLLALLNLKHIITVELLVYDFAISAKKWTYNGGGLILELFQYDEAC